jgi:hypothetical protein
MEVKKNYISLPLYYLILFLQIGTLVNDPVHWVQNELLKKLRTVFTWVDHHNFGETQILILKEFFQHLHVKSRYSDLKRSLTRHALSLDKIIQFSKDFCTYFDLLTETTRVWDCITLIVQRANVQNTGNCALERMLEFLVGKLEHGVVSKKNVQIKKF